MRRQAKGWVGKAGCLAAQHLSLSCGGTLKAAQDQSSSSWVVLLPGTTNPKPPLIQQLLVLLLFKEYFLTGPHPTPPIPAPRLLNHVTPFPPGRAGSLLISAIHVSWWLRAPGSGRLDSPPDGKGDLKVSSRRSGAHSAVSPLQGAAVHERRAAAACNPLFLYKEPWSFYVYCWGREKKKKSPKPKLMLHELSGPPALS